MRAFQKTLALVGAVLLVPALAMAAVTTPAQKPKTAAKTAAKAATHSTRGVVQSVDDTTLVIARTAKATKTETFVINASTVKKGTIAAGARVGVRYRADGGQNVATAVTVTAKGKGLPQRSK
jgi:hypothetical protein